MATFFNNGVDLLPPSIDPSPTTAALYYSKSVSVFYQTSSDLSVPIPTNESSSVIYYGNRSKFFISSASSLLFQTVDMDSASGLFFNNKQKFYLIGVNASNIDKLRSIIYLQSDHTSEILLERFFTSRPILIAPAIGKVIRLADPLFIWKGVNNADFYEIHIASDSAFINRVIRYSAVRSPFQGNMEFGGLFYWRVRAVSLSEGIVTSDFSDTWNFQTSPIMPGKISTHSTDGRSRLLTQFQENE